MIQEEKPMGKTLKRGLIVGIVFLFLSTACLPVLASEELPDLIVESINIVPDGDSGMDFEAIAEIKNIGISDAIGSVEIYNSFNRLILLKTVFSKYSSVGIHLAPNESTIVKLTGMQILPHFGFFIFNCQVNTGRHIEESNYKNNRLDKVCMVIVGQWFIR
jgi:hypothetical protein